MPLYDFVCRKCGKRFTLNLRMGDYAAKQDRQKCPHCGSTRVERHFEAFFAMTAKKS